MRTKADMKQWMDSAKYLPEVMRDFHDGKDLFKAMHEIIDKNETANDIGFRDGMIYTIDVFLWFMARRGYTLQRSRKDLPFRDLQSDIEQALNHRNSRMTEILKQQMTQVKQPDV